MPQSQQSVVCCIAIALCISVGGCSSGKSKTEEEAGKTKTPEEEVKVAIDGVITAIEKEDFKTFIVKYMPVDDYRQIRDMPGGIDKNIAELKKMFKQNPERTSELLTYLRAAKKVKPVFSSDNTVASFKVSITEPEPVKWAGGPLLAKSADPQTVTGYGGDVAKAVQQATADLEAGKLRSYLANMLPQSDLANSNLGDLEQRLKDSGTLKQTIFDLKQMQSNKPTLQENDTIAVWTLPMDGPAYKADSLLRGKKPQTRTIKLQKSGNHWRLFDNTSAMKTQAKTFSRKAGTMTETLTFEKIGSDWRISDNQSGGKSVRRSSRSERKSVRRSSRSGRKSYAEPPEAKSPEPRLEKSAPKSDVPKSSDSKTRS